MTLKCTATTPLPMYNDKSPLFNPLVNPEMDFRIPFLQSSPYFRSRTSKVIKGGGSLVVLLKYPVYSLC